jgi:tRNA A-37 threonylcarbamoyl transferase component Bud32
LTLHLPEGELLLCKWLRVLPNRRYVAIAEWRGRQVLAKLLVGGKARRAYQRECSGFAALIAGGVATPRLLAHDYQAGTGGWLLYNFLSDAESLGDRWRALADQSPLSPEQESLLGDALTAIGALHRQGIWQEDLHLDNLLCHVGRLYWVDCGSIRKGQIGRPLDSGQAAANLGVFFAQLPASFECFADDLLGYYRRGGGVAEVPADALQRQIVRARRWRLRDFLAKTGRDCTLFSVQRGPMRLRAAFRDEVAGLQPVLADPDRFIAAGEIIKDGGSSTVALVIVDGRPLVIKRCNVKSFWHWLRRCWRPSRAWHAWREGHRLGFLGVATARPLAVLERRCCWLRRRAYLVSEWLAGENILCRFAPYVEAPPPPSEVTALVSLFATLVRERISHGDLKGTNLIWHGERWQLIDLDAVRRHASDRGFARAFARDRARFLRNWPAESALYKLLDECLPHVPT